jgi:hypothetical protein
MRVNISEYGTELEKQVFNSIKGDKSLCRVEAVLGYSCSDAVGTSNEWCFDCER